MSFFNQFSQLWGPTECMIHVHVSLVFGENPENIAQASGVSTSMDRGLRHVRRGEAEPLAGNGEVLI